MADCIAVPSLVTYATTVVYTEIRSNYGPGVSFFPIGSIMKFKLLVIWCTASTNKALAAGCGWRQTHSTHFGEAQENPSLLPCGDGRVHYGCTVGPGYFWSFWKKQKVTVSVNFVFQCQLLLSIRSVLLCVFWWNFPLMKSIDMQWMNLVRQKRVSVPHAPVDFTSW